MYYTIITRDLCGNRFFLRPYLNPANRSIKVVNSSWWLKYGDELDRVASVAQEMHIDMFFEEYRGVYDV